MEEAGNKRILWLGLLGVCLLAVPPLFVHLDSLPLFVFDEGRLANNALEMTRNGNWLVTHYDGKPDLWSTKPPLMVWLQALAMQALGYEVLAVRLPSALAGLATILVVFAFTWRFTRSAFAALAASLVLLSSPGFVDNHVTRTGDYDALLTLFSASFLLFILLFTQSRKSRDIWLAMAAFTLSVLAKGISVFLFLPGLLLFLLASRQLLPLLKKPAFYLSLLTAWALLAAFYLGREAAAPGYLEAVMKNELSGRFLEGAGLQDPPWYFYLQQMGTAAFLPWAAFLPLALLAPFADPKKERRPVWHFVLWMALGFLALLSASPTRLFWYAAPAFPLLAMAIGAPAGLLIQEFAKGFRWSALIRIALFIGLFLVPYGRSVQRAYVFKDTEPGWESRQYAAFMEKVADWPAYTVVQTTYNAHSDFYVKAFRTKGQDLDIQYPHELLPGDTVLLCEDPIRAAVLDRWSLQELTKADHCGLYQVGNK